SIRSNVDSRSAAVSEVERAGCLQGEIAAAGAPCATGVGGDGQGVAGGRLEGYGAGAGDVADVGQIAGVIDARGTTSLNTTRAGIDVAGAGNSAGRLNAGGGDCEVSSTAGIVLDLQQIVT